MYNYHCDICGCYLDPGEGRLCEECQARSARRIREGRRIERAFHEESEGMNAFEWGGEKDECFV